MPFPGLVSGQIGGEGGTPPLVRLEPRNWNLPIDAKVALTYILLIHIQNPISSYILLIHIQNPISSYILLIHILTSPHCFPFKNMPTLLSHDNLCLYSFNIQIRQVVSQARHTFISKLYSIFDIDDIDHPGRSSCESSDHS